MSTIDPNSPPDTSTSSSFSEGQVLAGCYALSRRLTTGEGAQVWLANDDVLGKDVTLHFLPSAVSKDSRALQELRAEVKRGRQLIHPQILRVYDLIEEPEWTAVSMNAFEGESLALRRTQQPGGRFAASEIEPWAFKLVQTIDDAHKVNFLHRDLAPENIFLTPAGQPLVANFGISRTIQEALVRAGRPDASRVADVSPQTLEGGTPARTDDVYSLGAVLYTLLVGTPPFSTEEQVRAGVTPEILSALEREEMHVPVTWRKAIAACLQKSPESRPQTASELLKILKGEASAPIPADVVPLSVEPPRAEPVPVAKAEPLAPPVHVPAEKPSGTPPVETSLPEVKKEPAIAPAASASSAQKLEAALGPEPEVEIVESKALEELAKFVDLPAPARPASEPPVTRPARIEPKKPGDLGESGPGDLLAPSRPEPKKPSDRLLTDFKPRLYPEESRFPVVAIGLAAVVLLFLVIYFFSSSSKKSSTPQAGTTTPAPAAPAETPAPETTPKHAATPAPPVVVVSTPAPAPSPEDALAQKNLQNSITEKQSAVDKAKQSADEAEKTHADRAKDQQSADAVVAESQKAVDEKARVNDAAKAEVDEMTSQGKKLADSQKTAEAAAAEAQKVAAEKARIVEQGKKALEDLEKEKSDKVAAQDKAAAELDAVKKTLAEKQRLAADAAKAAADAEAARQQLLAAVSKNEQDLASAKTALEMHAALAKKIENLQSKESPPVPSSDKPAPSTPTPVTPAPATPVATPPKLAAATPVAPIVAKLVTPVPATPTVVANNTAADNTGANSLGMKFAYVGDIEFCIWLVRVKDFEVFAKAVNLKSSSWESPGFRQGPDHPVVNVTWVEAVAFCKWLTDKEHKDGTLAANLVYRLPYDLEWSKAVGLPDETGKTPEARDMDVPDVYPWGTEWPPPKGAGNYTGEETGSDVAIKGYDDGYAWTSPVGSFNPNKYGLYDMGGNVWEWCMDNWNTESKAKVLRGASWYNGALKLSLLSSCRVHAAPDSSTDNYGFRIIRAPESAGAVKGRFR